MDPIANINEQRETAREIMSLIDGDTIDETILDVISCHADRLAELVIALDEWRRKGGFDPYQRRG